MSGHEAVAALVVSRAMNALPEGLIIALFAWLIQRLAAADNSGARFSIWLAALTGIVGLPFAPRLDSWHLSAGNAAAGLTLPGSWATVVLSTWAAVAATGIARLLLGVQRLRRLKANSQPVHIAALSAELRHTFESCNSIRGFSMRISNAVSVPTAVGFLEPAILFPQWTWESLSSEDLKAVVLHEFAHLERRDDWINLAQRFIACLFFFHPAVWWVDRRLRVEREIACDELVLARTGDPEAYARCLVSLAEQGLLRRSLALANAAVGRARDLSLRLARILSPRRASSDRPFRPALSLAGIGVLICVAAVSGTPEFIAFRNSAQTLSSTDSATRTPGAQVVSASLHLANPAPIPKQKRALSVQDSAPPATTAGIQARSRRPITVTAGAQTLRRSPQVLVLTQTTNYDGYGDARVSFILWRVTIPYGNAAPQAEVIARSL
jgi:beta-lactamase regulating signal transducer with metallopeptidase domain